MANTIFFNGRVTAIPGSYSEIDVTGLAVVGLSANGIVAILGEAEGGEPGVVIPISNPGKVGRTFRDGDLREAGNIVFDPSKDPDIPSGAQEAKFVKVNPATQSTLDVANSGGDVIRFTSIDFGLFTTQYSVTVEDGTNQGKSITIDDGAGTVEVFDDLGGTAAFNVLHTPGANGATTMVMDLDNSVGVSSDFTRGSAGLASAYVGSTGGISGLDSDFAATIAPGNVADVQSSSAADTTQTVTIFGIDSGSGLPATEVLALVGLGVVVGTTTWSKVLGVLLSAATVGIVTVRDNGTATTLTTLAPAVLTKGLETFGGEIIEGDNSLVSLIADGATTEDVIVVGEDEAAAAQLETIALTGAVLVAGTAQWSEVQYLVVGNVPAARTLTMSGIFFNLGDVVSVVSNDAGDTTQTITFYGLDASGVEQTETLTLNGVTPVAGTATWSEVLGAVLSALTTGTTITVSATTPSLTVFAFDGSASLYAGFDPVDNLTVNGSAVTLADSGATEDRNLLLVGLDAVGASQVILLTADGGALAPVELWSEITGIVTGHLQTSRTMTVSGETFNLLLASFVTVNDISNRINSLSGWTFDIGANAGTIEISDMDNSVSSTVIGAAKDFFADLAFIVTAIVEQSALVTAETLPGFTGPPDNVGPVFLVGGIEGTTTFADWQAALDILREEFVSTVVVLTADASIHAAALAHAVFMAGPGRKERDCIFGAATGETLAQLKARAVALNTRHARLAFQDSVRFNVAGVEEQFPPYFTGLIAAGMQGGSSIGTSLTFKFLNVLDIIGNDASYNLIDDGNEMIQSGLWAVEKVQGVGFRNLRNITTHLIDNNLAFTEASVNEAVNFAAFEIRTALEAAVGRKGFAGTVNAAAAIVITELGVLTNPQDPIVVAWRNLTIELDADTMTVDVELAPVIPTNFVKTTIHLVTASFALAA